MRRPYRGAGWRYPSTPDVIDQDNSCTQYAMLAMKSARRLGAKIPMEVFERIADFLVLSGALRRAALCRIILSCSCLQAALPRTDDL